MSMSTRTACLANIAALLLCSCSSTSAHTTPSEDSGVPDAAAPPPVDAAGAIDAYAGAATEHGIIVDYNSQQPVPGLTVTDNGASTTTDANGMWSLAVPPGATLAATVTGPNYTNLLFPYSVPAAADIDFATNVMPTSSIFQVEQNGLSNDTTKALVQIVVITAPSCASPVGGSLSVLAPAGTTTVYFAGNALPDTSLTSFQAVAGARPVAVVFDVAAGAALTVTMAHPTCKQVPFPYTYKGKTVTGAVPTKATEPGDYNSALVLMLE